MSTREAGIKLTLNNSALLASLDGTADKAKSTGQKIKSGLSAGFSGVGGEFLKGGKDALKDVHSGIKNIISTAGTLGGVLSFGEGVHSAMRIVSAYKDIAFAVETSTGKAQSWQAVQADVQSAADRWKISNDEVAASYLELFKTTEDLDYTRAAIDSIGKAHRATGTSVATLTAMASDLNEKFGVTPDKIDSAMTTLIGAVPGGKAGLEELGDKLGLLGASARTVGYEGEAGLKKVLGMLNMAGAGGGSFKKELMSVIGLLETLGDSDQVKKIEKTLGHGTKLRDKEGKTRADALEIIMRQTGGKHEELSKVFNGPLLRFTSELGKTYEKAFAETAGDTKTKTAAATAKLSEAMEKAGKVSLTSAQLQEQATARLKDPEAQLQDAMNKFKDAFAKPEMIEAMNKFAAILPRVGAGMAWFIEKVFDHPLLAGGAMLGAKVGGGVLSAGAGKLGENILGGLVGVGKNIGKDIAGEFSAGTMGWGKAAGSALGIAGGAILAFEIGKAFIDARIADKAKSQNESIGAGVEATNALASKDPEKIKAAREKLQADYNRQVGDYNGAGGFVDAGFNALAGAVDSSYKPPEMKQMENTVKQLDELNAALAALTEKTSAAARGSEELASGSKKAGAAAQTAANQLSGINGSPSDSTGNGTSKGPPRPGNAGTPGYVAGG